MEHEGSGGSGGSAGLLQQILSLKLVPRVGNGTLCPNSTSLCSFPEMWYGVFLWALVSSLFFHVPAGLLALFTLRHHKYGRFMSVSILLMGIVGPITAGILTSMLDIKIPVNHRHTRQCDDYQREMGVGGGRRGKMGVNGGGRRLDLGW
ncbi:transmembrane protein 170A [Phyllostomus discolor]|uniref:Transmembrane protein 170A n=1 Tax=Phyllostomus discolor TaxID=89673 RepID=A0A833YSE5_9CHIR|nr:transmembrane protein 170A [Phyllostomus discolor]